MSSGLTAERIHYPQLELAQLEDNGMADDNINPSELSDGFIIDHWLTTIEVAEMHQMTTQAVVDAIHRGVLIGKKIGGKFRGQWYVEPESAAKFEKGKTGPKRDKK